MVHLSIQGNNKQSRNIEEMKIGKEEGPDPNAQRACMIATSIYICMYVFCFLTVLTLFLIFCSKGSVLGQEAWLKGPPGVVFARGVAVSHRLR